MGDGRKSDGGKGGVEWQCRCRIFTISMFCNHLVMLSKDF